MLHAVMPSNANKSNLRPDLVGHGSSQSTDDGSLDSETGVDQVNGELLAGLSVGQTPGHVAEDAGAQSDASGHGWVVLGLVGQPENL